MSTLRHLAAAGTCLAAVAFPGVAADATTAPVPTCTTHDLTVSLRTLDGAAGSAYYRLVLRNRSDHTCRTGGYGGVSMVGDGDGTQVGAAAVRDTSVTPTTVVLPPGHRARALLRVVDAGDYPASRCRPEHVDGLRVYPPNQTRSAYVAHPMTGCANSQVHLMTLRPYVTG